MALVFGVLVGAMSMTPISDSFGRKRTFLFNTYASSLALFVTAWVNNYYLFTAMRFLLGVFQQASQISALLKHDKSTSVPSTVYEVFLFGHFATTYSALIRDNIC